MSPWTRGSDEVDALLAARHLKRVTGADVGTRALMERAQQLISSARSLVESDPVTAYVVAYDAAKPPEPHCWPSRTYEQPARADTSRSSGLSTPNSGPHSLGSAACAAGGTNWTTQPALKTSRTRKKPAKPSCAPPKSSTTRPKS